MSAQHRGSKASLYGWLRWWGRVLSPRTGVPSMRLATIEALKSYAEMTAYIGCWFRTLVWLILFIPFAGIAVATFGGPGGVPWWWAGLSFVGATLLLSAIEYLASVVTQ